MSPMSADARAVVEAVDRLTTQVKRLADAQSTPVAVIRDGVMTPLDAPTTTADDEALRTARRESLRNLLNRIDRYVAWTPAETELLRRHVETEMREADTARAVAAGNKRHVQLMYEEVQAAEKRAAQAEELLSVAHETSNRSETERAKAAAELEQAQAAIDRVRAVAALIETGAPWTASQHNTASRILAALDGTEQPTTADWPGTTHQPHTSTTTPPRTIRPRSTMADSLSTETVNALLAAIKKHAEQWEREPATKAGAEALNNLAEAYAWVQRPIRGTAR